MKYSVSEVNEKNTIVSTSSSIAVSRMDETSAEQLINLLADYQAFDAQSAFSNLVFN